jgi:transposase-like protein
MPETRRRFVPEFRDGAVRIVPETGKPIVVARELGIDDGKLGNWVKKDRQARGAAEGLGTDEWASPLSVEASPMRSDDARDEKEVRSRVPRGRGQDRPGDR